MHSPSRWLKRSRTRPSSSRRRARAREWQHAHIGDHAGLLRHFCTVGSGLRPGGRVPTWSRSAANNPNLQRTGLLGSWDQELVALRARSDPRLPGMFARDRRRASGWRPRADPEPRHGRALFEKDSTRRAPPCVGRDGQDRGSADGDPRAGSVAGALAPRLPLHGRTRRGRFARVRVVFLARRCGVPGDVHLDDPEGAAKKLYHECWSRNATLNPTWTRLGLQPHLRLVVRRWLLTDTSGRAPPRVAPRLRLESRGGRG